MINQARRSTHSLINSSSCIYPLNGDSERIQRRESDWFSCLENRYGKKKKKGIFFQKKSDKKCRICRDSGLTKQWCPSKTDNFHKSNSAGKDLLKEASLILVPAAACTEDCPKASTTHMLTTSFRPTEWKPFHPLTLLMAFQSDDPPNKVHSVSPNQGPSVGA